MRDNLSKFEPRLRDDDEPSGALAVYALLASAAFLLLAVTAWWKW